MQDRAFQKPPVIRRRFSALGHAIIDAKIERARRLTPEERLRLALELSDVCYELRRALVKSLVQKAGSSLL